MDSRRTYRLSCLWEQVLIGIVYRALVHFSHITKFLVWVLFSFFRTFKSDFLWSERKWSLGLHAFMVSCKAFYLVSLKFWLSDDSLGHAIRRSLILFQETSRRTLTCWLSGFVMYVNVSFTRIKLLWKMFPWGHACRIPYVSVVDGTEVVSAAFCCL